MEAGQQRLGFVTYISMLVFFDSKHKVSEAWYGISIEIQESPSGTFYCSQTFMTGMHKMSSLDGTPVVYCESSGV